MFEIGWGIVGRGASPRPYQVGLVFANWNYSKIGPKPDCVFVGLLVWLFLGSSKRFYINPSDVVYWDWYL